MLPFYGMQSPFVTADRFRALDSWRGIAALMVALCRLEFYSYVFQIPFFRHAFLFVDFFCVLSGFVITHAYAQRLRTANDASVFLIPRIGRVWPLDVAIILAFVALEMFRGLAASQGFGRGLTAAFDPSGPNPLATLGSQVLLLHEFGFEQRLTWN
jgi:peptidoglycan/LPS O-acetylase OafA/YrhL